MKKFIIMCLIALTAASCGQNIVNPNPTINGVIVNFNPEDAYVPNYDGNTDGFTVKKWTVAGWVNVLCWCDPSVALNMKVDQNNVNVSYARDVVRVTFIYNPKDVVTGYTFDYQGNQIPVVVRYEYEVVNHWIETY